MWNEFITIKNSDGVDLGHPGQLNDFTSEQQYLHYIHIFTFIYNHLDVGYRGQSTINDKGTNT